MRSFYLLRRNNKPAKVYYLSETERGYVLLPLELLTAKEAQLYYDTTTVRFCPRAQEGLTAHWLQAA